MIIRIRDFISRKLGTAVAWLRKRLLLILVSSVAIVTILEVVMMLYSIDGSGFGAYVDSGGKLQRGKTLWDWVQLFIAPLILAAFGILINTTIRENENKRLEVQQKNENKRLEVQRKEENARLEAQRENEVRRSQEQLREQALQNYFDRMDKLLLEKHLGDLDASEKVKLVAQVRTQTILRELDTSRREIVIYFLCDAKLINGGNPAIRLLNVDLHNANLSVANLQGARLIGANLQDAFLWDVNLQDAFLWDVNLQDASLVGANLQGANLELANLQDADLSVTMLQGTNLQDANLQDTNLSDTNLSKATLPNGKPWVHGTDMTRFTDPNHPNFWRSDNLLSPAYRGDTPTTPASSE